MVDEIEVALDFDHDTRTSRAAGNIREYLEHRISTLRRENDGDSSDTMTAKRRGGILELKALWRELSGDPDKEI